LSGIHKWIRWGKDFVHRMIYARGILCLVDSSLTHQNRKERKADLERLRLPIKKIHGSIWLNY